MVHHTIPMKVKTTFVEISKNTELITVKKYAEEHNLSESAVKYRIANSKIKAKKIKGKWYIVKD